MEAAGLKVKPNKLSVSIEPPANGTRMSMYAYPTASDGGGQLYFEASLEILAEFYPNIDEGQAVDALRELNKAYVSGDALDALLEWIERFLTEQVPHPDVGGV